MNECKHRWQHDFCGAGVTICEICCVVKGQEDKPSVSQQLTAEREKVRKLREALLECEKQILQERNDLLVSSTNFGIIPPKVDDHIIPFINEYDAILSRTKQALKETE